MRFLNGKWQENSPQNKALLYFLTERIYAMTDTFRLRKCIDKSLRPDDKDQK